MDIVIPADQCTNNLTLRYCAISNLHSKCRSSEIYFDKKTKWRGHFAREICAGKNTTLSCKSCSKLLLSESCASYKRIITKVIPEYRIKSFGSGALSGKILLVRIIGNNKIDANFWAG